MKFNKVTIKQIPNSNSSAVNLEKYGKSRFPNCIDTLEPYRFPDGRYLTGLDEHGMDVLLIQDLEKREEKIQEIKETLDFLKKVLPTTDLSPSSSFWENFRIKIDTNSDLVLTKAKVDDILKYHVLIANGYAAPSLEESSDPKYLQANYYLHVDEIEEVKNVSVRKMSDKAKAELSKIENNKDLMYLIGSYLEGTKYKRTMNANTLYINLSEFIEDKKNTDNVEKFLKAAKLPLEDLQFKVILETAIRKKIIKFKEGQYYRGAVNLGRNLLEVMANLKSPEYANEFIQIHEEVNNKY